MAVPGRGKVSLEMKKKRGIGNLHEAFSRHLEDCYFRGGAVAVLHAPKDPEVPFPNSLQVHGHVHEVFHGFGAGKAALFRDVGDEESHDPCGFCDPGKLGRGFPHLGKAPHLPALGIGQNGLEGVHYQGDGPRPGLRR
jgi:hypothetical protein